MPATRTISCEKIDVLNAHLGSIEESLKSITCADLRSGASIRMIVDAILDLERVRESLGRILS